MMVGGEAKKTMEEKLPSPPLGVEILVRFDLNDLMHEIVLVKCRFDRVNACVKCAGDVYDATLFL